MNNGADGAFQGNDKGGFQGLLVVDTAAGDNDFMKAVCRAWILNVCRGGDSGPLGFGLC